MFSYFFPVIQCSFLLIPYAYNAALFFPNLVFNNSGRSGQERNLSHFWVIQSIQGKSQLKPRVVELVVSKENHLSFGGEDLTLLTSNQINKGKVKSHENKANPFGRLSRSKTLESYLKRRQTRLFEKELKRQLKKKKKRLKKRGLKKKFQNGVCRAGTPDPRWPHETAVEKLFGKELKRQR